MAATPLDNYFQRDTSRLTDEILRITRERGRVSALIQKGELPEGIGYNYSTVLYKRSGQTGGNGWVTVAAENGTANNCVPTPNTVAPASTTYAYTAEARTIKSNPICFEDLYRAYKPQEQIAAVQENFQDETVDTWEDRDKLAFFTNAAHKVIADENLTEGSASMPLTVPTTRPIQSILDIIYMRNIQNGAGNESYAKANGAPLFPLICSMEASRNIIKEDPSTRQDFNYADMGEGAGATLLKAWGVDKAYGGYMHTIDNRMPRWDFVGGAWVQRPYYVSVPTTIGDELVLNPAYDGAAYEDMYIWHPQVVKRLMPKPGGSFGSMTSFNPVKWSGAIFWLNIPNETENPFSNIGRYWAALQAAYEPRKPTYGWVIRVARCNRFALSPCY